jgi:hypothetical protein
MAKNAVTKRHGPRRPTRETGPRKFADEKGTARPADTLRDLHRTLIHEHAHRAVAMSYGVHGSVEVEPNPEGGFYQIHYTGRFTMYGRAPSSRAIRLIGLAGPLATMLLDDDAVDERDAVDELEVDDSFSTADRAMAGRYTITDVRAAIDNIGCSMDGDALTPDYRRWRPPGSHQRIERQGSNQPGGIRGKTEGNS